MKRYLLLLAAAVLTFTACTEDEGTTPGGDGQPNAVLYTYAATLPNDPDLDCALRIAVNNKTQEVYYLGETAEAYQQHIDEMGEKGYIDYIVANGAKISDVKVDEASDVVVKNLAGDCKVAVVAASGNARTLAVASFTGYSWTTLCRGTYYFGYGNAMSVFGFDQVSDVELQVKDADNHQMRFKNLFAPGYHLCMNWSESDDSYFEMPEGYHMMRVAPQSTPFAYSTYGTLGVRDVGYWQGNDDYMAYYPAYFYPNGYMLLTLQWFVSAGNTGYAEDEFYPEGMEEADGARAKRIAGNRQTVLQDTATL